MVEDFGTGESSLVTEGLDVGVTFAVVVTAVSGMVGV